MISIEEIIGNLLLRHNCVVIPSFGGFVAKQISAQIDYNSGLMLPPRKSLLFNRQLINNDGLLITELVQQLKCEYSEAEKIVSEKRQDWQDALKRGERVTIDRVGYLFFDQEKNICFEQDRFFNLLLSSYGLGKVHFLSETEVAIAQHEAIVHPIKVTEEISIVEKIVEPTLRIDKESEEKKAKIIPIALPKEVKAKNKAWKYIAAACVLPIAFYSVWIPMKTDVLESGMISFKDFNPFNTSVEATYSMDKLDLKTTKKKTTISLNEQLEAIQTDNSTYQYNFSDNLFLTVKLTEKSVEEPVIIEKTEAVSIPKTSVKKGYNYIIGCFSDQSNAANLVSKLKSEGLNAVIVDVKNGLHRVSAGTASSQDEFAKIISVAESKGYQGWVLK